MIFPQQVGEYQCRYLHAYLDNFVRSLVNHLEEIAAEKNVVAGKFFTAGRPRIRRKSLNAIDDSETIYFGD
jgi:hypothetical protein